MPSPKHHKRFNASFAPEEWNKVLEKSKAAGLKPTTYVKRIAVHGEIKRYDTADVQKLTLAINKFGVNLNQIAQMVNATNSVYQADMFRMSNDFDDMKKEIKAYLREMKYSLVK
jgi:RAB protein geranylgeranyltransferase component A